MDADKKAKVLEIFDFESFTVEELASVVRKSGLYPSDKIITRMEQLYNEMEWGKGAIFDHLTSLNRELKEDVEELEEELERK